MIKTKYQKPIVEFIELDSESICQTITVSGTADSDEDLGGNSYHRSKYNDYDDDDEWDD